MMRLIAIPQIGEPLPVGEFLAQDGRFSAVYALFNRGEIVYIGQSKTLRWRIQAHLDQAVKVFDAVAFAPCSVDQLMMVEGHYIRHYAPKYNACSIATKSREREPWRAERNRHDVSRNKSATTDGIEFVDASECFIDVKDLGAFFEVSDREAGDWIKAGMIDDRSVLGLIKFAASNSRSVTAAQSRYEEL